tara:strand:- start:686 stop:802 length:117 start_codon:yes stop_codon:yes gene_type:complete
MLSSQEVAVAVLAAVVLVDIGLLLLEKILVEEDLLKLH